MNRILKHFFIPLFICTTLFSVGCGDSPEKTDKKIKEQPKNIKTEAKDTEKSASPYSQQVLKLGRIPFTNSSSMVRKHNRFLDYLTEELGVKQVRLQTAPDYNSVLEMLIKGKIDIAWLASNISIEARNSPEVELLVKPIRFGSDSYRGIIITRQDSGIRRLNDLKGKKFAWVEKESASGYIFPKALLLEAGINPGKDFAEASFLGKHDAVVLNVLLGKYDAGACYDDARNTLRDKEKMDELTILATTPDISNEPIVCRKNLPQDLIEKIKKAFLDLNEKTPENREVLENLTDVEGFVPAEYEDYNYIEKVQKLLKEYNEGK
ncbi:MAG: phosphate/phosphite/phosphonate ABC transporter substrate-binding protein [Candidatus Rifleibacteriota bacterium]